MFTGAVDFAMHVNQVLRLIKPEVGQEIELSGLCNFFIGIVNMTTTLSLIVAALSAEIPERTHRISGLDTVHETLDLIAVKRDTA